MTVQRTVVAGQAVAERVAAYKKEQVILSTKVPGCYESNGLVGFQKRMNLAGYLEAEIVKSNYGYSLRFASGLQNFGLIRAARGLPLAETTYEAAVDYAKDWQSIDPEYRYVTTMYKPVSGDE